MTFSGRFIGGFVLLAAAAVLCSWAPVAVGQDTSQREQELIAVLRSAAPPAQRAITCKHLAVHGSSKAVPVLAPLLKDPQLASWARIALEAIPGPEADAALRNATKDLQGLLLVGTINSIGVRRDAGSVDLLSGRLQDKDVEVASAAAVALGHIGNDAATASLQTALQNAPEKVRSAVAEGCVLCAERLLAEGKSDEAVKVYDQVRTAQVPQQRILEATRGAILARQQDGIPLLVEQLRSPDEKLFQIALSTAREFPGEQVDKALAEELGRAAPQRAALVIVAMADRGESVVLPAVLKAAASGPQQVRLAAIEALGRVGDASCLAALLRVASEDDAQLAEAARSALAALPGKDVDQGIVARLSNPQAATYPVLIELVGQRRIDASSALLKALDHSDKSVRQTALASLGRTIPAESLSVLIARVVSPTYAEDVPVAQQALKTACVRMPDREACAAQLTAALEGAPASTKSALLETLGAVGGTKALQAVGTAAKSNDEPLRDTSTRLLGQWMTSDAAPVLLDLAKTGPADKYQGRALRGYIRIARQFNMPPAQRLQMCRDALATARQPAEQKLVLDVLQRYPSVESLKLAVDAGKNPELKDQATQTAVAISQKLGGKADEVRKILSQAGAQKVKLEIVKAEYGAGSTQKDVTSVLQKQAGDSLVIALPSDSYNAAFGGDPLPGKPKVLKIEYRVDGKAGEATFDENSLIVLPMPK